MVDHFFGKEMELPLGNPVRGEYQDDTSNAYAVSAHDTKTKFEWFLVIVQRKNAERWQSGRPFLRERNGIAVRQPREGRVSG